MTRTQMQEWLSTEFLPLTLASPKALQMQLIENAIRYWNTHSAYPIAEMYSKPASGGRVQLSANYKNVLQVWPSNETSWVLRDHPLWTLVGIQVLDNVTSDLIVMTEAYRNYRFYTGTDFTWHFERSDNPAVGGYLYAVNLPQSTTNIYVLGTKHISTTEDITSEHIYDWIQRYAKALLKMAEGNTLRKSGLINANNDGEELVQEGKEEIKELQDVLAKEGRWTTFIRRR